MKAGCLQAYGDKKFSHAYEARWNAKKAAPLEFMQQPMTVTAGGKYDLGEQTSMNYMLEMGANRHFIWKFAHKVDRNWKVAGTQSFNFAPKVANKN